MLFFVQENFSNVVYNKICNYVSKKVIFLNNNNNNTLIYIAPACRMTSEAL